MAKYPVVGAPQSDPLSTDWTVTVDRAPGDTVTKRFPNRSEAREATKQWRLAAKVLTPRGGYKATIALPDAEPPRTKSDLVALLSRTITLSQAGEIPISSVQPIIQLAKLQLKLLDMKDPEDDLSGLTEAQILDRIFEQLTTDELVELAMQRLDARKLELAA